MSLPRLLALIDPDPYPNPDLCRILKFGSWASYLTYFNHHDRKNIGCETVKFKSGVTAIWREIAHLTIIESGSGYVSDLKIRSRCVICRARNRIQTSIEAASNA
jgi:hypothetical protein